MCARHSCKGSAFSILSNPHYSVSEALPPPAAAPSSDEETEESGLERTASMWHRWDPSSSWFQGAASGLHSSQEDGHMPGSGSVPPPQALHLTPLPQPRGQGSETGDFLSEGKRINKKLCVSNHEPMLNSEGESRSSPQQQIKLGNTKRGTSGHLCALIQCSTVVHYCQ